MQREPVTSSNLRSLGYNQVDQAAEVEFNNGAVYRYPGVAPEDFDALAKAGSIGSHFQRVFLPKYKTRGQRVAG